MADVPILVMVQNRFKIYTLLSLSIFGGCFFFTFFFNITLCSFFLSFAFLEFQIFSILQT